MSANWLSGLGNVSGHIDVFEDIVQVVYDWQSSRTRRVLSSIMYLLLGHIRERNVPIVLEPFPEEARDATYLVSQPRLFAFVPRVAPIMNASAVLDFVSGYAVELPRLPIFGERPDASWSARELPFLYASDDLQAAQENDSRLRMPDDPRFDSPGSPNDPAATPCCSRLTYGQTRDLLAYFMGLVDYLNSFFEPYLAPILATAERPGGGQYENLRDFLANPPEGPIADYIATSDVIPRLLRFTPENLCLNRGPGTIYVPWFHPFEFDNDFVGWGLAREDAGHSIDRQRDPKLWPLPRIVPLVQGYDGQLVQDDLTSCYPLSGPITLYSGQRLIGTHHYVSPPSTRLPPEGQRTKRKKDYRTLALFSYQPADWAEVSLEPEDCWFVRMAAGDDPVKDVVLQDLFFQDDDPINLPLPDETAFHLQGVINLDGAERARLTNVYAPERVGR